MGKVFMAASNYLPTQVSGMMNQDRAFATGRLSFSGLRNICTLSTYVWHHSRSTLLTHYLPKAQTPPNTCQEKRKRVGGQEEG